MGRVRLDPMQIEQILMNLAAMRGTPCPRADAALSQPRMCASTRSTYREHTVVPVSVSAVLTVSDTGAGIFSRSHATQFRAPCTTKPLGQGTGLGLAFGSGIVKRRSRFCQVHGGAGMGTVFGIFLPCVQYCNRNCSIETRGREAPGRQGNNSSGGTRRRSSPGNGRVSRPARLHRTGSARWPGSNVYQQRRRDPDCPRSH